MLSASQQAAVSNTAKRAYDQHVHSLIAAVQCIEGLDPLHPNRAGAVYEDFLKKTFESITLYHDQFVKVILRATERVAPDLSAEQANQIMTEAKRYVDWELYEKRMALFNEALDRRAASFGVAVDRTVIKFDLVNSRYITGYKNLCNRLIQHLKQELEVLTISSGTNKKRETFSLNESLNLKPGLFGIEVDLKKLWQWIKGRRSGT